MVLGEAVDSLLVALVVLEIVVGAVVVGETRFALAFALVFLALPLPLSATTHSQYLFTFN